MGWGIWGVIIGFGWMIFGLAYVFRGGKESRKLNYSDGEQLFFWLLLYVLPGCLFMGY